MLARPQQDAVVKITGRGRPENEGGTEDEGMVLPLEDIAAQGIGSRAVVCDKLGAGSKEEGAIGCQGQLWAEIYERERGRAHRGSARGWGGGYAALLAARGGARDAGDSGI